MNNCIDKECAAIRAATRLRRQRCTASPAASHFHPPPLCHGSAARGSASAQRSGLELSTRPANVPPRARAGPCLRVPQHGAAQRRTHSQACQSTAAQGAGRSEHALRAVRKVAALLLGAAAGAVGLEVAAHALHAGRGGVGARVPEGSQLHCPAQQTGGQVGRQLSVSDPWWVWGLQLDLSSTHWNLSMNRPGTDL